MTRNRILSIINILTYSVLAVVILFFMIGTAAGWGIRGVLMWAMALIVFLFGAFLAGFCLSQLFPDRRSNQFKMIFNMTEFVVLLIITLAGLELSQNTSYVMGLLDPYKIHSMSYSVALDSSILRAHSPVLRAFTQTPALYGVVRLMALFYRGMGADEAVLGSVFMILHMLCSFFTYRLARMVSGRVASVAVYGLMMLVPSQLCVASVANINLFAATFVSLNLYLFAYSRRMSRMERSFSEVAPVVAFAAASAGFAAFFNPVAFILPIGELLFIFYYQVNRKGINPDSKKERISYSVLLVLVTVIIFLLLCLIKSFDLKVSAKEVFLPYFHAFFPGDGIRLELPAIWGSEDYSRQVLYYHSPLQCQIAYGCVLAAAFACVVMNWILKQSDYFVLRLFILASVVQTAFAGTSSMDHTECYCLLTVLCGGLFGEVYSALRSKAFRQMQEEQIRKEQEKALEEAKRREEEEREEREWQERKKARLAGGLKDSGNVKSGETVTQESKVLTVDDVLRGNDANDNKVILPDPLADGTGKGVSAAASFSYGDMTKIKASHAASSGLDGDYPEDDGGVITLDDVLGKPSQEDKDINDGSDGSMLSNPMEIKERQKNGELDFDFSINDEEDFDV